jgi:hypothetical protein
VNENGKTNLFVTKAFLATHKNQLTVGFLLQQFSFEGGFRKRKELQRTALAFVELDIDHKIINISF